MSDRKNKPPGGDDFARKYNATPVPESEYDPKMQFAELEALNAQWLKQNQQPATADRAPASFEEVKAMNAQWLRERAEAARGRGDAYEADLTKKYGAVPDNDPDAELLAAGARPVADDDLDAELLAAGAVPVSEEQLAAERAQAAERAKYEDEGGLAYLQGLSRYAGGDIIREGLNKVETWAQNLGRDANNTYVDTAPRDFDTFQSRDEVAKNKEYNPVAATAGEVTGIVSQVALPALAAARGGAAVATPGSLVAGAASRAATKAVGEKVTEGAILRTLQKTAELGVQGAVEGAYYGTAKELNDAYLAGDYDHLAEKTLAGAVEGASAGAKASIALGGAFALAGKAARALRGTRAAAGAADDAAGAMGTADDAANAAPGATAGASAEASAQAAQRAEFESAISQRMDEAAKLSNHVEGNAEGAIDLSIEPLYMQRGALVSRDLAQSEISKAQQVFAQARAAEGGFDKAQQGAVRGIAEKFNKLLDISKRVDRFAGVAQKRAATQAAYNGVINSTRMPEQTRGVLDSMLGQIDDMIGEYGETALADKGGLLTLKGLRSKVVKYGAKAEEQFAKGDAGSAVMTLDDLKRAVGDAQGSRNPVVRRLIEGETGYDGLYGSLQRNLQDADTWGEWAQIQGRNNASWTEKIRRSMDQQIQRFFVTRTGEMGASPWESGTLTNREALGSFLKSLGDEETMGVEEAFRRFLRATEIDAVNRAGTWGSPELAAEAKQISGLVTDIETQMNAVALSRANAKAWEKATRDIGDIPVVGSTIKGALRLGQKVASRAQADSTTSATTTVRNRADMQASSTAQAMGQAGAVSGPGAAAQTARKAAIKANKRLSGAPARLLEVMTKPNVQRATEAGAIKLRADQVINEAEQLQDPSSPLSQDLQSYLMEVEQHDPAMAQALANKLTQQSQFLLQKAGPRQTNQFGQPMPRDPLTQAKLERYATAAVDPVGAIERLANGNGTEEDRETMPALYPSMWNEFVLKTMERFKSSDVPHRARVRASLALGVPFDPSLSRESLAFTQSRMAQSNAAYAQHKAANMAAQVGPLTGDRIAFARS